MVNMVHLFFFLILYVYLNRAFQFWLWEAGRHDAGLERKQRGREGQNEEDKVGKRQLKILPVCLLSDEPETKWTSERWKEKEKKPRKLNNEMQKVIV